MNMIFIIQLAIDFIDEKNKETKDFTEPVRRKSVIGCLRLLYRFLPFAMDDRAFLDALLWQKEDGQEESYGTKLGRNLMSLCFKHEFTIKLP